MMWKGGRLSLNGKVPMNILRIFWVELMKDFLEAWRVMLSSTSIQQIYNPRSTPIFDIHSHPNTTNHKPKTTNSTDQSLLVARSQVKCHHAVVHVHRLDLPRRPQREGVDRQPHPVEVLGSRYTSELDQDLSHPLPLDELLGLLLVLDEVVPGQEELLVRLTDVRKVSDPEALQVRLDVLDVRLTVLVLAVSSDLPEDVVAVVVGPLVLVLRLLDLPDELLDQNLGALLGCPRQHHHALVVDELVLNRHLLLLPLHSHHVLLDEVPYDLDLLSVLHLYVQDEQQQVIELSLAQWAVGDTVATQHLIIPHHTRHFLQMPQSRKSLLVIDDVGEQTAQDHLVEDTVETTRLDHREYYLQQVQSKGCLSCTLIQMYDLFCLDSPAASG